MKKYACQINGNSTMAVIDDTHISFTTLRTYCAFGFNRPQVDKAINRIIQRSNKFPEKSPLSTEGGVAGNSLLNRIHNDMFELFSACNNLVLRELHMDNGEVIQLWCHGENDASIIKEEKVYTTNEGGDIIAIDSGIIVCDFNRPEWWTSHPEIGKALSNIREYLDITPWDKESPVMSELIHAKDKTPRMNA